MLGARSAPGGGRPDPLLGAARLVGHAPAGLRAPPLRVEAAAETDASDSTSVRVIPARVVTAWRGAAAAAAIAVS